MKSKVTTKARARDPNEQQEVRLLLHNEGKTSPILGLSSPVQCFSVIG